MTNISWAAIYRESSLWTIPYRILSLLKSPIVLFACNLVCSWWIKLVITKNDSIIAAFGMLLFLPVPFLILWLVIWEFLADDQYSLTSSSLPDVECNVPCKRHISVQHTYRNLELRNIPYAVFERHLESFYWALFRLSAWKLQIYGYLFE